MKKVSLSVHKSNIERRERAQVRKEMTVAAKSMSSEQDIVSYAIVGFDRSGKAFAAWDTGKIMPKWAFPGAISRVLDFDTSTVEDDYVAPLHRTEWPK